MRSEVGAACPFTRLPFFLLEDLEVPLFVDFVAGALLAGCEVEACEAEVCKLETLEPLCEVFELF